VKRERFEQMAELNEQMVKGNESGASPGRVSKFSWELGNSCCFLIQSCSLDRNKAKEIQLNRQSGWMNRQRGIPNCWPLFKMAQVVFPAGALVDDVHFVFQ